MPDLKDSNFSPMGRKWDNTLVPRRPKWSLGRAAFYGLAASVVALFLIDMVVGWITGQQKALTALVLADPIYLVARLGFLPLIFVAFAAIRNQYYSTPEE